MSPAFRALPRADALAQFDRPVATVGDGNLHGFDLRDRPCQTLGDGASGVLSGEAPLQRVRGYEDPHRLACIVAGAGTQSVRGTQARRLYPVQTLSTLGIPARSSWTSISASAPNALRAMSIARSACP